ncbi:MAG: RNA methyltransferase [Acidimicrobiales bacterium]
MAGGGGDLSGGRSVSRAATAGRNLWNPSPRGGSAGTRGPIIKRSPHSLGGEQVEGRQAVRELLAARRRQVTEVWMTEGSDPSPILGEIDRLAREAHVPVRLVSQRRLESVQGTDAPQGVVAFAEPLTAASLDELVLGWNEENASARSSLVGGPDLEIDDDEDDDTDDEGFFIDLGDDEIDDSDDDGFPVLISFVDETDEPESEDEDSEIEPVILSGTEATGDTGEADSEAIETSLALDESIADALVEGGDGDSTTGPEPDRSAAMAPDGSDVVSAVKKALKASTAAPSGQPDSAFLVLLEGVTDPQNLGAILRSAECAGVTGVAVPRHRSVHVTPAVTKAAAGAIEYLQMALVPGMPSALQDLEHLGVMTVGLDERGTTSLYDLDLGDRPVALVLGSEGAGLSPLSRRRCEVLCRIPVDGEIPSLNVSAAAAVACFEVARQRAARKRR